MAPDLDMRPGEPARSTLGRWVATCRSCGAAAPDLSTLPESAAVTIRGEAYRSLRGPAATLPHLRWALICRDAGWKREAAAATLAAAWALDDADASAVALRREAAQLWGEPEGAESALRLLDIRRRAGDFEEAARLAARLDGSALDETSRALLAYQTRLVESRDASRHMLSSVLRPPARTPHVTHKQAARTGVFGRLFRGK